MDPFEREKQLQMCKAFSTDEIKEIEDCIMTLPNIKIEARAFVEDDTADTDPLIRKGDIYKIEVKLTDLNLKDGEERGYAHSKHYVWPKSCTWWLIILSHEKKNNKDREKIIGIEMVTSNEKVMTHTFDFMAEHRGTYQYKIILKPDCYIDLDLEEPFSFIIHPKNQRMLDQNYFVHPDDIKASKTKSFFQDLMGQQENDSDEEEEEEDEEDEKDNNLDKDKKKAEDISKNDVFADSSDDEIENEEEGIPGLVNMPNLQHFEGE